MNTGLILTEQFDILDGNGELTGMKAVKGTQLSKGQYYLGVHVYMHNMMNEFLLQQRSYAKEFLPGGWDVILEHVIAGETSKAGAIRGIQEEIGLRFENETLRFIGRIKWEMYHHMIDIYFLQTEIDIHKLTLGKDEVIGAKLVSSGHMLELVDKTSYRPARYRSIVSAEINKLIRS